MSKTYSADTPPARGSPVKTSRSYKLFALVLIGVVSFEFSRAADAVTVGSQDPGQANQREPVAVFLHPWATRAGDTADVYLKRILPDGSLTDFPADQRFCARIPYFETNRLVFPNGSASRDTSGVQLPFKLYLGVLFLDNPVEAFALDVKPRFKDEPVTLTAPSRALESLMWGRAGIGALEHSSYEKSRTCFLKALKLDSTYAGSIYYNISCTYARQHSTTEALDWLRKAFDNGFNKYIHALKNDSDLISIRSLPEFRSIVTAPLVRQRNVLTKRLGGNPSAAGGIYFDIARTYLEQSDLDSFFVSLEMAMQKGYFPNLSWFDSRERRDVQHDRRLLPLLERYYPSSGYKSSSFEARQFPTVVTRLESENHDSQLGNYRNLRELIITKPVKTDVPPEMVELPNLKILRYSDSGLQTFPVQIANISPLEELTISRGVFQSLPADIDKLASLRILSLDRGLLNDLPLSFDRLSRLATLTLAGNAFSSLPGVLTRLPLLEMLDLSNNSIEELPDSFSPGSQLAILRLGDNRIRSVPTSLCFLPGLVYLDLSINQLTDLPREIGNLKSLKFLDLSFNELKTLPHSLVDLKELRTLVLFGNQLPPPEIDSLRVLLPGCNVIGGEKSSPRIQPLRDGRLFADSASGISFFYPSEFSIAVSRAMPGSDEFEVELARNDTNTNEINSETYYFVRSAGLSIQLSREEFSRVAYDAGFERNTEATDSTRHELDSEPGPLWVSLGRQGMESDAASLSFDGWKGLYGTNFTGFFGETKEGKPSGYQGLEEFFAAFARKKFSRGQSISVSYWTDLYETENVFWSILASIRMTKRK